MLKLKLKLLLLPQVVVPEQPLLLETLQFPELLLLLKIVGPELPKIGLLKLNQTSGCGSTITGDYDGSGKLLYNLQSI